MTTPLDPIANAPVRLRRALSLPLLTLYGLGTTIGGGIYVLIGRMADRAGMMAPVSFLVAAVLTAFTAFCFAELASRFPKSAGEAVYVHEGFGRRDLALVVGFLVIVAGLVSSAALARGFVGYFHTFLPVADWAVIVIVVLAIGLLAAWGIGESVSAASFVTLVEMGGLILVIGAGGDSLAQLPVRWRELVPGGDAATWAGILGAAFLAFYAFIGFEDMVNIAEEVENPERALPLAIVITLVVTTILYFAVSLVAVLSVPLDTLRASGAPLVVIAERQMGEWAKIIAVIGIFAVLNGALIQIIMAARVLYGMAREGWIHSFFGRVHRRTQTPIPATAAATAAVVVLALVFPIEFLAEFTSLVVLCVAVLVNAALLRMKLTRARRPGAIDLPIWVPAGGVLISLIFVLLIIRDLAI